MILGNVGRLENSMTLFSYETTNWNGRIVLLSEINCLILTTTDVLAEIGQQNRNRINKFCFCLVDYSHDEEELSGLELELFHRKNIDEVYVNNDTELLYKTELLDDKGYFLNSRVKLYDGTVRHLAMLDFSISVSIEHTEEVKDALAHLGLKHGYILDSGSSYHFIGTDFFSYSDYMKLLHYAFLLSPITDGRWIAHQLIEESCNLRIGEKNGFTPTLIEKQ